MAYKKTIGIYPRDDAERKLPFEQVYEKYYFDVFRFINNRIGNYHEAEDLTGEVFLYCYKNYERYDCRKSAITTWLFLIAKSMLKTYYRDKKVHVDISELEDWLLMDNQEMNHAVYLEQLRAFLGEQIAGLPEKQQQVIVMRYFKEMEFDDIAAALGTTPGNVRVILTRTITKLNQNLSDLKNEWSV